MTKYPESKCVVCFGEILWDVVATSTSPGGAPMNVAYHLNKLYVKPFLISRVGKDLAGDLLLSQLSEWGLSVDFCDADPDYPTSEVRAVVNDNQEVSYEILSPVAWDFIPYRSDLANLVAKADALVYGSLATRSKTSRETLYRLLEESKFNVFDVNLRPPHYTPDIVEHLLHKTHLLKLNQQELVQVTEWFSTSCTTEAERVKLLHEKFGINEIIVTKGSQGACSFTPGNQVDCAAYKVKVADTIGSGDAFLAAYLSKRLRKMPIPEALSFAATLAGFVTTHHGACPEYTLEEVLEVKKFGS